MPFPISKVFKQLKNYKCDVSICDDWRISPLKPISPKNTDWVGSDLFVKADVIAAAQAKSQAGSVIFNQPATLR